MEMNASLRAWLELARVSNLPTVWTNVLAAWLLAGGQVADARLGWLIFGGSLLYSAGMILNDAADAAYDRMHRPERAIPSGRVALRWAWRVGLVMLLCGAGMMAGRGGADALVVLVLAAVILAYDLYHKPWAGSVLLMGACRTLLYLAAASALTKQPWTGPALLPGLALGAYIVGLSLMARAEARPAGERRAAWPLLMLLISPALLSFYANAQDPRPVPLLIGAGLLLWISAAVKKMRSAPPQSIGSAVGRLLAGIVWVDAMAIAGVEPWLALVLVAMVPLLLLWQRRIAAT